MTLAMKTLRILYNPLFSSLCIGYYLPSLIGEKKYDHIPLLVLFPGLYTGYQVGSYTYKFNKLEEQQLLKKENYIADERKKFW